FLSIPPSTLPSSLFPYTTLFRSVGIGFLNGFAPLFTNDSAQGGIDVLRHSGGIATNENLRVLFQPTPNLGCVLEHAMLNVHFLRLIAREGGIESGQNAVGLKSFQVRAIRKIAGFALRSKEQPISATCSDCLAFLKKCTEWRQSCAWTNHDHCSIRILREMEMFGHSRINRHRTIVRSIS